jgi:hypothetical protein
MRRWLGVVIVAALAAGPLEAQGLGEAAAKEKRRREEEQKKNKGPAKVITTEDLTKVTATTANAAAPGLAQDAGARPREDTTPADETRRDGATPPGGGEGPGGQDEKSWRTQAAELRKEIQAAEQKAASVQQENDRLFAEIQRSTDTNEILRLRAEQNKVSADLEIAKQELANLRQEWAQFEESARRAGVPPGWIR